MNKPVLIIAVVGAVTTATVALQKPQAVPPDTLKLLDSYDELMNDLELLKKGEMGVGRLRPINPDVFKRPPATDAGTMSLNKSHARDAIRKLRRTTGASGERFVGDGLIAPKGKELYAAWSPGTLKPAEREALDALARYARTPMFKEPKRIETRAVGEGYATAKPILFRHKSCMSCHPGKKVGDVAAIAVVTWKPKE